MTDLEANLTDEEQQFRDTVHRFAEEVVRPVGQQLDTYHDPAQVIAPDSPLWDVHRKYRDLGVRDLDADPSIDPLQRARLQCILTEEMGWGDAGLAISTAVVGFPRMMAQITGKPEIIERFSGPEVIGCWAITEPDHGSDLILLANRMEEHVGEPNCLARREGDEFVISGQKAAWVSNGTIATAAALFCAVDNGDGNRGLGCLVVPLDAPGVSKGKPLDKLGQRALNQGEIFFDSVRVSADHLAVPPELMPFAFDLVLSTANSFMGMTFAGTARSAYELAVEYAKDRRQGGRPIIEHQSVKARLFTMFRKVEAAKSLARRVLCYNAVNPPRLELAIASKVTATQTAFEVASDALQIFGGNGLSREYPIEKILRDARASMIEDGCNEVLGLNAAERF